MNYRWKFRQALDEKAIYNLANSLKIPRSLASVLVARGLSTQSDVLKFFEPKMEDVHDPLLMNGMEAAIDRILSAVKSGEPIIIQGDYDVDGTASTSMLLQFLREIGANVDYYIPDRFSDGYGMSIAHIDELKERGTALLITVDLGITAYEPLDHARKIGMDVIICDHHEPGDRLPPAVAILDPLKPDCTYPFKYLSAAGVTLKLMQGIARRLGMEEKAFDYLDYVAISSAADMVPLIGENRIFTRYGLNMLNSNPRPGLKGLIYCTQLKHGTLNTSSIVYSLAPLINAAGRLGDAKRSVEMMIQKDEISAFRIAQQLEQENRRRRFFDEQTFEEAIPLAEKYLSGGNKKSLVLHGPNWHPGVIGIVASRLVDRYHLPTVLLTTAYGMAKGSARSINSFDIHTALKDCSRFLFEFGGHKHAAGLSLAVDKVDEFAEAFDKIAQEQLTTEMLVPEILVDTELRLNELSPKFMTVLEKFAPFGFENFKPVFYSRNVKSSNGVKIIGNHHLKFRALQSNFVIDAIGYNLAEKMEVCSGGKPFAIVYHIEENNYNGHTTIQLRIKDIRPDDN